MSAVSSTESNRQAFNERFAGLAKRTHGSPGNALGAIGVSREAVEGLGDPFAEVFAAMSIAASATQVEASESEPEQDEVNHADAGPVSDSSETVDHSNTDPVERKASEADTPSNEAVRANAIVATGTEEVRESLAPAEQAEAHEVVQKDSVESASVEVSVESDEPDRPADLTQVETSVATQKVVQVEQVRRVESVEDDKIPSDSKPLVIQSDIRTPESETASTVTSTVKDEPGSGSPDAFAGGQDGKGQSNEHDGKASNAGDAAPSDPADGTTYHSRESSPLPASLVASRGDSAAASSSLAPVPGAEFSNPIGSTSAVDPRGVSQAGGAAASVRAAASQAASRGTATHATQTAESTTDVVEQRTRDLVSGADRKGRTDRSGPAGKSTSDVVLRAKLVQRVSKAFQHFGNEGGNIRLKLAPAELGSVRVEMQVRDKKVQARVVAETESAAQLLREQLPELRGRLEAQGMQVDQLNVEHESDDQGPAGRFGQGDVGNGSGDPSPRGRDGRSEPGAANANRSQQTRGSVSDETNVSRTLVSQTPSGNQQGVDLLY